VGYRRDRFDPSWLPLMVFAFLFGLSMEYEVFILSRIREEYDRSASAESAVVAGIGAPAAWSPAPPDHVPGLHVNGIRSGHRHEDRSDRSRRRHHHRRHRHPRADRSGHHHADGRWNWWMPSWSARLLRVEPSLLSGPAPSKASR
jgi:RND superfamily putative drug exporter